MIRFEKQNITYRLFDSRDSAETYFGLLGEKRVVTVFFVTEASGWVLLLENGAGWDADGYMGKVYMDILLDNC